MKHFKFIFIPLVACIGQVVSSYAAEAEKIIGEGGFNEAQVAEGEALYLANCAASCHLRDLTGLAPAPALIGPEFRIRWEGMLLSNLLERIEKTMPPGKLGILDTKQYESITTYIVSENSFR